MKKRLLLLSLVSASFAFAGNTEPAKPAEAPKPETGSVSAPSADRKPQSNAKVKDCCAPVEPAQKPAGK